MIVKFTATKKDQWDDFLDTCVFAYNTAKHESTLCSPFELMFGRKAVLPVDIDFESKDGMQLLKDTKSSSKVCQIKTINYLLALLIVCHIG